MIKNPTEAHNRGSKDHVNVLTVGREIPKFISRDCKVQKNVYILTKYLYIVIIATGQQLTITAHASLILCI